MADRWWEGRTRGVRRRLVIEGRLTLQTPAHLGNGEADATVDLPLLLDERTRSPLLQGTSLAGALRAFLQRVELGYRAGDPSRTSATVALFGGVRGDDEGAQSPLIVDDSLGERAKIEPRSGVRLEGWTRTAADDAVFDLQVWAAGTEFPVRFELLLRGENDDLILRALGTALGGFNDAIDSIRLGARTNRGYGRLRAGEWTITSYALEDCRDLLAWLAVGHEDLPWTPAHDPQKTDDLLQLFGLASIPDVRRAFSIDARFRLVDSIMNRTAAGVDFRAPDLVHLHSRQARDMEQHAVQSGTSLGGALRSRCLAIAHYLALHADRADALVDRIFGSRVTRGADPIGSKLRVEEHEITQPGNDSMVQHRIALDPFTQAPVDGALFAEAPVFAGESTGVRVQLLLRNPAPAEIGLLLLALKDLWLEDVVLSGEGAVGRGRLRGDTATLGRHENGVTTIRSLRGDGLRVTAANGEDATYLQEQVAELHEELRKEEAHVTANR